MFFNIHQNTDLFEFVANSDKDYVLAHCVSADYVLGGGIAVEFVKRYDMRNKLRMVGRGTYPACIKIDNVYNLVTKETVWHKPTYQTVRDTLEKLRDKMLTSDEKFLAIPKIACGLDGLDWEKVQQLIVAVFWQTDITIDVCLL